MGSELPDDGAMLMPIPPVVFVSSTAAKIHSYNPAKGDLQHTRPLCDRSKWRSKFNTAFMKQYRLFAMTSGMSCLSEADRSSFWTTVVIGERVAANGQRRIGPMERAFSSPRKFVEALENENDSFMVDL